MFIVDTHTHLDHKRFAGDLDQVINRAKGSGVGAFIIPGADPNDIKTAWSIARAENIFFAAGVHPNDIDLFDLDYIESFLSDPKCVAIGECGLDYFRLPKDKEESESIKARQKDIFRQSVELADRYNMPLIVHTREASEDCFEILTHTKNRGGVLHCYGGDALMLPLAKAGFYFGIGGILTFSNAKELADAVRKIPLDRIVLETDAPYLAPTPHRGGRNESAYTVLVAEKLADLLDMPLEKICEITTENAKRCFPRLKLA
ncbi:MAG: TatD family hydrolase [Helicobacteraceae bacterium]|jgi:TatD DNase family protein|nr:TatD family hydrolase [Helicobacteraceae bacterium]